MARYKLIEKKSLPNNKWSTKDTDITFNSKYDIEEWVLLKMKSEGIKWRIDYSLKFNDGRRVIYEIVWINGKKIK